MRFRIALATAGVLFGVYGAWLLVSRQRPGQLLQVGEWAVAGVLLHDAVLAPVVIGLGWLGTRLLRGRVARLATLALLVAGTLTLVAVPALVRVTLPKANPTLLDRDYGAGWLVAVAAVVLALALGEAVAALWRRNAGGPGPGRR